jgi:hypothetical protein
VFGPDTKLLPNEVEEYYALFRHQDGHLVADKVGTR